MPPTESNGTTDTVTVTALSRNTQIKERESTITFTLNSTEEVSCKVIQRGTDNISFQTVGAYALPTDGSSITMPIEGNIPFDPSYLSIDTDWLTFDSITGISDSTLLSDGKTMSRYYTAEIIMTVKGNETSGIRSCDVVLDIPGSGSTLNVIQVYSADMDRTFYRHSAMLRFTATWCGNCPIMGTAFENVETEMPGRYVPLNIHPLSSDYGLGWSGTASLEKMYEVTGYPMVAINGFVSFYNMSAVSTTSLMMSRVAEEAVTNFPSKTNIMAFSSLKDNTIQIDVFIAAKESGDYLVSAFVLEDGIIAPQTDSQGILSDPQHYTHKHIVRECLTGLTGDPVPAFPAGGMTHVSITGELPSNVANPDNTYIVIYTSYAGEPDESLCTVPAVTYRSSGYIIDNAISVPMNGMTGFEYETGI